MFLFFFYTQNFSGRFDTSGSMIARSVPENPAKSSKLGTFFGVLPDFLKIFQRRIPNQDTHRFVCTIRRNQSGLWILETGHLSFVFVFLIVFVFVFEFVFLFAFVFVFVFVWNSGILPGVSYDSGRDRGIFCPTWHRPTCCHYVVWYLMLNCIMLWMQTQRNTRK